MSETNETAMQVVQQPADQDGGLMCWPKSATQYMTSLGNGPGDVDKRVAALSAVIDTLKNHVGEILAVADWFIHTVDRIDQKTGETKPGPRLVLILADGSMIATSSAIVAGTIGHLCSLIGFKSFDPPKNFMVGQGVGPNGKYLTVTPVEKPQGKKK